VLTAELLIATSSAPAFTVQAGLETLLLFVGAKQIPEAWFCLCMSTWIAVPRFQNTTLLVWAGFGCRPVWLQSDALVQQIQLCNLTFACLTYFESAWVFAHMHRLWCTMIFSSFY